MVRPLEAVGLAEIEDAATRLRGVAWRTPTVPASRDDDGRLLVKLEALQRLGSFKIRGAFNRMDRGDADERKRGFVTVSAGNHGQAVAWSARRLGAPCRVFVPEGAVARKVESMRAMGADVRALPHEAIMDAMRGPDLPFAEGLAYVHPFGDPHVLAGQGTVGLEIVEDVPEVRSVVVPVGGGGLACGIAAAVKALAPRAKVYGVQAEGADPLPRSLERGEPVATGPPRTFADGMAATRVFPYMWPLLRARLDGAFRVPDEAIARAVRHLAKECHVVAEGAGAAALAAAWAHADALEPPIVAVASGGNLDPALLASLVGGA